MIEKFILGTAKFGFDYDYMFKRAKECGKKCITDFVKVSKIMDNDAVIKPLTPQLMTTPSKRVMIVPKIETCIFSKVSNCLNVFTCLLIVFIFFL